ncbi:MAG: EamA family transporter [Alphaproteobacteria bacterium]|nr:EamA family transporter [Alphaproteobacteria bacterium]
MVLGALLAVLSSAAFALNGATVRRGVLKASVSQGMAITVPIGVPLFFLAALLSGYLGAVTGFSAKAVLLLSLAGILHFVWGRYCNYRATKAMGANAGMPLRALDFPLKLALAIVFLGEVLTPLKIFGIGLILAGGALAIRPRKAKLRADTAARPGPKSVGAAAAKAEPAAEVFTPNYTEGYTFILLSITGYGLSPLLIRMALEDAGLGAALAGGLVSYLAATVVIALTFLKPGQFKHVRAIDSTSTKWFLVSALFVALSHMFRYMALAVAPITVVAPVQRAASLLKVVFNWLINRNYEVFERRLLAGIFVSVLGGVLLTLSTDFVINAVPLPDFAIRMIDWSWSWPRF